MQELAAHAGVSNVYLKRMLIALDVPIPPRGHWNKVRAGQRGSPLPRQPRPTAGERCDVWVDGVTGSLFLPPVVKPTPIVEDDGLAAIRQRERDAIGIPFSALSLRHPDAAILSVIARDAAERINIYRPAETGPALHTAVGRRQLRLLNALFHTLRRRGHDGTAIYVDSGLQARATIGLVDIRLRFDIRGRTRWGESSTLSSVRNAAPGSRVRLRSHLGGRWGDDRSGVLEDRIGEIVVDLIVEAEVEQRAVDAKARQIEATRERARVEALQKTRLAALISAARSLRDADAIRALLTRVEEAAAAEMRDVDVASLTDWLVWARGEVAGLDPLASGAIAASIHSGAHGGA
ncbi:hypothetical protein [Sphingomonas sp. UYP23]